jgi:hypothetical protein
MARIIDENAEEENPVCEARNRVPLPSYAIIVVVVLFTLNVGYETYEDMDITFSVSGSQSKTCILRTTAIPQTHQIL